MCRKFKFEIKLSTKNIFYIFENYNLSKLSYYLELFFLMKYSCCMFIHLYN